MRQRDELELIRRRISFIGYAIVAALLVLVFGFWNAQIVQSGYYQQRAEQNRIREIPLPAPRGKNDCARFGIEPKRAQSRLILG